MQVTSLLSEHKPAGSAPVPGRSDVILPGRLANPNAARLVDVAVPGTGTLRPMATGNRKS